MIFGSVCSGIEAASVAWHPLGWRADMFVQFANRDGTERVEEENRKKRENPLGRIIPMKR